MKVLYVTSSYESVQTHLIAELRAQHVDARIFWHTRKKHSADQNKHIVTYRYPVFSKGFFLYLTKLLFTAQSCKKYCLENGINVLHGNMAASDGMVCRKVCNKTGIPYVLSVRDTDLNVGFLWKIPWIKKGILKNLKQASSLVFLSNKYLEKLIARLPDTLADEVKQKAHIIPNGIDNYFLENTVTSKPAPGEILHLVFVGRINARKNLETTVKVLDELNQKGIKTDLMVVGEIEDASYNKLINEHSNLNYHKKSPKEQVLSYLRQADIFVMPSHTESFGLVYAEAMSQGLPVIYTRGQGFDGQFADGVVGYAVNDRDPSEITDKIELILQDYPQISKRCIELSSRFDWIKIARELNSLCYMQTTG